MQSVTLEAIVAKQSELEKMIQQMRLQSSVRVIEIEGRTIELQPGERYAGARLDEQGNHLHDVVVLADRPSSRLNWDAAIEFGLDAGGELASTEDYALIKANCPDLLTEFWYWTNKEHESDASYAWYFDSIGSTYYGHKSASGGALVVRRF